MPRARNVLLGLLAAAILLCVGGCQTKATALCNEWVDAFAQRGVRCGHFETHQAGADAVFAALPQFDSCADVERIVLPDLWELECIPETRALACDAAEFPNACRGQLVAR